MNLAQLVSLVRRYTRDSGGSLFKEADVKDFINDAIDRVRSCTELKDMQPLVDSLVEPVILPSEYHRILALYATARCFAQDEQHYQATNYMNEFENKFAELQEKIKRGEVKLIKEDGTEVVLSSSDIDAVIDVYFSRVSIDTEG